MSTTVHEWHHRTGDEYQAVILSAWMNESDSGIWYRTTGQVGTFSEAVSRGFADAESDDFQIAVLRKGRLAAMLWMLEVVDDEPGHLAEVATQTGLPR
jgi:hypothetical protein